MSQQKYFPLYFRAGGCGVFCFVPSAVHLMHLMGTIHLMHLTHLHAAHLYASHTCTHHRLEAWAAGSREKAAEKHLAEAWDASQV
jgi:hypothetical protein